MTRKLIALVVVGILFSGLIGGYYVMHQNNTMETEWQQFKNKVGDKISGYISANDLEAEGWEDNFAKFLHKELSTIPKYEELCSGWSVNFKPEDGSLVHIDLAERPIYKWHRITIGK